ncbi:hypothetical protein DFJ74DRAFT_59447 [Hyaloraphidium curvatum]|nr:hypothetical protein DFJ74DRAFT_59447 [Hyaloraphidium curvatum]
MRVVSATVRDAFPLPVPAASGVELLGRDGPAYVVGDASTFLYEMDPRSLRVTRKIPLFGELDASEVDLESLPKAEKPDFEFLCVLPPQGGYPQSLFAAGSGSLSPNRDWAAIISLENLVSETYFIGNIYDALRSRRDVVGEGTLNLEGCTVVGSEILFFQRGNAGVPNVQVSFPLAPFLSALRDEPRVPPFVVKAYALPTQGRLLPGFSGAGTLPGTRSPQILFSATLEDTPNGMDDGTVHGSLIGLIPAPIGPDRSCSAVLVRQQPFFVGREGDVYPGKVEGVCVMEDTSDGRARKLTVAAVTDMDGKDGEWLIIDVVVES